jgi:hypothetical protein
MRMKQQMDVAFRVDAIGVTMAGTTFSVTYRKNDHPQAPVLVTDVRADPSAPIQLFQFSRWLGRRLSPRRASSPDRVRPLIGSGTISFTRVHMPELLDAVAELASVGENSSHEKDGIDTRLLRSDVFGVGYSTPSAGFRLGELGLCRFLARHRGEKEKT